MVKWRRSLWARKWYSKGLEASWALIVIRKQQVNTLIFSSQKLQVTNQISSTIYHNPFNEILLKSWCIFKMYSMRLTKMCHTSSQSWVSTSILRSREQERNFKNKNEKRNFKNLNSRKQLLLKIINLGQLNLKMMAFFPHKCLDWSVNGKIFTTKWFLMR